MIPRFPAVAGQFYPSDSLALRNNLKELFFIAQPKMEEHVLAIIVPHAGYIYSGQVAASGYNQLDPEKKYETIFIIGSSHRASFEGASVYSQGCFITPLGEVEIDVTIAEELRKNTVFKARQEAHMNDHVIEVQLPFLQYHLKNRFRIVPILIGTDDPAMCTKIAYALRPYFNDKNLFVISSDFSHYPAYDDAVQVDKSVAEAILSNSSKELLETLKKTVLKNIKGLETSLCSRASVLTLLYLTEGNRAILPKLIAYGNSGNTGGDKKRVVGYNSIAFTTKSIENHGDSAFVLSEEDKSNLLFIARLTIEHYLRTDKILAVEGNLISENLKVNGGAFVTLHKNNNLRGCIGRLSAGIPLYQLVQQMAVAAATEDSRFERVSLAEMKTINLEISLLSPLKKIESEKEIVLGKHGIYIKKGYASGTFLPQVAIETGWTVDEFLGHCSKDKAGLNWDEWKTAEVYTYTAEIFREKERE